MKLVVSSLTEEPELLREQLADHGYVFVRDAIAAEVTTRLQIAARRAASAANLMSFEGRLASENVRDATRRSIAGFCQSSDFRCARYAPSVRAIVRALGGGRLHPAPHAAYARFVAPHDRGAKMLAHQDQHFLPRPYDFVTVWIPVMMPRGGGGIAIAPGSHARGRVSHVAGGVAREPDTWGSAEYAVGDAVVFSGYTIHKSLSNHSSALRVSVDYRYVLDGRR